MGGNAKHKYHVARTGEHFQIAKDLCTRVIYLESCLKHFDLLLLQIAYPGYADVKFR